GFDSAWAAEAWGTDAATVLAWTGARTSRIGLGSSIMQIAARTPAATAMTAATLDLLSGGRLLLGLGVSGPQVVEGWHGQPFAQPGFESAPTAQLLVGDDIAALRDELRPLFALYVGGMGAREQNFYSRLVRAYGWEREATEIQDLYLAGRRRDAAAAVPDELIDAVALVGPPERIRDRLPAYAEAGVTTLIFATTPVHALRVMAERLPRV